MFLNLWSLIKLFTLWMFSPSFWKSSSLWMFLSNSSTSQEYLKSVKKNFAALTKPFISIKSYSTFSDKFLCWTLTATSSPVLSLALWTCPIEADEIGFSSNSLKTSFNFWLSSPSMMALTSSKVLYEQFLVRVSIYFRNSKGTITSRVPISCPSLT